MRRGNVMAVSRSMCSILVCFFLAVHVNQSVCAEKAKPEVRAMWVDGFNDGYKTPAQCDDLLKRLRALHYNSAFVQMRRRGDAYYFSKYEPWAGDDPNHFDALAYLCSKAHAPGKAPIMIMAWVNACSVGGSQSPLGVTKLHPEFLSTSDTGSDYDGESTKIDPGNPGAADWTFRVAMDVVRHYNVDGIQLDAIRYGGDPKTFGHWGYNARSVVRFNQSYYTTGAPAWDDPRWQAWRRDQVTALVRRIYLSAHQLKPHIIVSADTICWGNAPSDEADFQQSCAAYTEVFAPWTDWLREGIVDLNCTMTYIAQSSKNARNWPQWSNFIKNHQYRRASVIGSALYLNDPSSAIGQMLSARVSTDRGFAAAGSAGYSWASPAVGHNAETPRSTGFDLALRASHLFATVAPFPVLNWLVNSRVGSIVGTAFTGDALVPLDGSQVELIGKPKDTPRTAIVDGTGAFGFLNVDPGRYLLRLNNGTSTSCSMRVVQGRVASATLIDNPKCLANVSELLQQRSGSIVTVSRALVTNGNGHGSKMFYISDAFGHNVMPVVGPNTDLPFVMGDEIAAVGRFVRINSRPMFYASAYRWVGCRLVGQGPTTTRH